MGISPKVNAITLMELELVDFEACTLGTRPWELPPLHCLLFANSPGDWGSVPGRVKPKTQKTVLLA